MCSPTSSVTETVGFGINVLTVKKNNFEFERFPLQEIVPEIVGNCLITVCQQYYNIYLISSLNLLKYNSEKCLLPC